MVFNRPQLRHLLEPRGRLRRRSEISEAMINARLERAVLLFQQQRWDLAEQELRHTLGEEPNNARAHAILALCLSAQEKHVEDMSEAQQAIHLAPDWSFAHYAYSTVLFTRNRFS